MDWNQIASDYYGNLPHPAAPSLKVSEYPTAVRLASATKFGGHASAQEAELFWKEFKGLGMSPSQYEAALKSTAPLSFAYHGRPPSMEEVAKFKDEHPTKIRDHYANLPDQHYPDVPAGEMVRYLQMASPHAAEHIDRKPVKYEAAMFHSAKMGPADIQSYYQRQNGQGRTADSNS